MQESAELGHPYGQTEVLRRAMARFVGLSLTAGGIEVSGDLLLRAILEDKSSEGARAFARLGVHATDVLAPASPAEPRSRRDVLMAPFSTPASTALGMADRRARAQGRPTTTGDLVAELLDADSALAERTSVTGDALRGALELIEGER